MKREKTLVIGALALLPLFAACEREAAPVSTAPADEKARLMQLIEERGTKDRQVLRAMAAVPREEFVPAEYRADAYHDRPLPIGHGQTISQPSLVALMTKLLDIQQGDKVLEIGTGSGYQAAILAELTSHVYTIEIIPELGKRAQVTLERLGYRTVKTRIGDGYLGWPEYAPFDAIIVTCAPDDVPKPLIEQLKEGGRMVIPVGPERGPQTLYLLEKRGRELRKTAVVPVAFVPMTH